MKWKDKIWKHMRIRRWIAAALALCLVLSDFVMTTDAMAVTVDPGMTESENKIVLNQEPEESVPSEESSPEEESSQESETESSTEEMPAEESSAEETSETETSSTEESSAEETSSTEESSSSEESLPHIELNTEESEENQKQSLMPLMGIQKNSEPKSGGIDIGTYQLPLSIYNYLQYSSAADGDIQTGSGTYTITGNSSSGTQEIYIGKIPGSEENAKNRDIEITLRGLELTSAMYVYPVFEAAEEGNTKVKKTKLLITEDKTDPVRNHIDELIVEDGAVLDIVMDADLSIGTITMGENSILNIKANKNILEAESLTGNGKVSITGGTVTIAGEITAKEMKLSEVSPLSASGLRVSHDLDMENTEISAMDQNVIAGHRITIKGCTLKDIGTLGFDEMDAPLDSEIRKIVFLKSSEGLSNEFVNVATIGAGTDYPGIVKMDGRANVGSISGNTAFHLDLDITYQEGEKVLLPEEDWPVYYRIAYVIGGTSEVIGSTVKNGTYTSAGGTPVVLPEYSKAGYRYAGWKYSPTEEPIKEIPADSEKKLQLTVSYELEQVDVSWDLDYTPDENSNDAPVPEKITTTVEDFDSTISVPVPFRFGYVFHGWEIKSGSNPGERILSLDHTLKLDELDHGTEGYSLRLSAVWEPEKFPIRIQVTKEGAQISTNGENWDSLPDFAEKTDKVTWDQSTKVLSFYDYIIYGETLGNYFSRTIGGYPVLRDASLVGKEKFDSWETLDNVRVTQEDIFALGGNILNRKNMTLKAYQTKLKATPITLLPDWDAAVYNLSVPVLPSGWKIMVDGVERTVSTGQTLSIPEGSSVSFRCPYNSRTGFSQWQLTKKPSDQRINASEREYKPGDPYIFYDFLMPDSDVEARYSEPEEILVDLYLSPIIFEEKVSYNNRTMNGFWYQGEIRGMSPVFQDGADYFYAWDSSKPFYVTSGNRETQNQLILVNTLEVHLVECNLVARESYSADVRGRKIKDQNMENQGRGNSRDSAPNAWKDYGNIVFDYSTAGKYSPTLINHGTNHIAAIFSSEYRQSANNKLNVEIRGSGELYLGSIWANMEFHASDITIREYKNETYPDNSEYLVYSNLNQMTEGTILFTDCVTEAENKRLFSGWGYIILQGTSDITVGGLHYAYNVRLYQNSFLHVLGDCYATYYGFEMSGSSSAIIGGDIRTGGYTTGGFTLNTTGYLVVEGNILDAGVLTMDSGTVIANAVCLGAAANIRGGRIITNQIMNIPNGRPVMDPDGYYHENTGRSNLMAASKNGDDKPFMTYSNPNSDPKEYLFAGGKIYLYGYYKTKSPGVYDDTFTTKEAGNPVGTILAEARNADGTYNISRLTDEYLKDQIIANAAENKDHECVILGNSTYVKGGGRARKVSLSGTQFMAAGNINFFNDVVMDGGSVACAGNFGSKRDLEIKGNASVKAGEISNTYNLTTTTNDGHTRYQMVDIKGGTIKSDQIGTSSAHADGTDEKSTIRISGGTVSSLDGNPVRLVQDVYVNYIYDDAEYTADETPSDVHLTGTWNQSKAKMEMKLSPQVPVSLAPPMVKPSGKGEWAVGYMAGPKADGIAVSGELTKNGTAIKDNSVTYNAADYDEISFYAVKENNNLVVKRGFGNISGQTQNDVPFHFDNTSHSANITTGAKVSFTVSAGMIGKTVIWYHDGTGGIHNVNPEISGNTISFRMPPAETEIWISNEMALDLDQYDIAFTKDGFAISCEPGRAKDTVFQYAGDLKVIQSGMKDGTKVSISERGKVPDDTAIIPAGGKNTASATKHIIKFEADSDYNTERQITLSEIIQGGTGAAPGIYLAENVKVSLLIDGAVQIYPIHMTESSDISFQGKNGKTSSGEWLDALYIDTYSACDHKLIADFYNVKKGTGSASFRDLWYLQYEGYLLKNVSTKEGTSLTMENCRIDSSWYAYNNVASYVDEITFRNCDIYCKFRSDTGSNLFSSSGKLTLDHTDIVYIYGENRNGVPFFNGLREVVMIDSSLDFRLQNSVQGKKPFYETLSYDAAVPMLTLNGTSRLLADHRVMLKNVILNDSSRIEMQKRPGEQGKNNETFLFCDNLTVNDTASVETDYLITSGYYKGESLKTNDALKDSLMAGRSLQDGKNCAGIVINGGTITAHQFMGGDRNSTITVNGGTVNTKAMGTSGYIYGCSQYIPMVTEPYAMMIQKIPPDTVHTKIRINGGTVNISENGYLGGMRSDIAMTNGIVNLKDGAVFGISETDLLLLILDSTSNQKELTNTSEISLSGGKVHGENASMSAPYSTIRITDTAVANLYDLQSENGTILISDTAFGIENPYSGTDGLNDQVGVLVYHELLAQNIRITNGASVYADRAFTSVLQGKEGYMKADDGTSQDGSHLYIGKEHGQTGKGKASITEEGSSKIHGKRQYSITYVLNADAEDPAVNSEYNQDSYTAGSGAEVEDIVLHDPVRKGYRFDGWYESSSFKGEPIPSITTAANKDIVLYARWSPSIVKFQLVAESTKIPDLETTYDQEEGTFENGIYTSNRIEQVPYHSIMIGDGENQIAVSHYVFSTYSVTGIEIMDERFRNGEPYAVSGNTRVTKELLEAYEENPLVPIRIRVSHVAKNRFEMTLHLNQNSESLPRDAFIEGKTPLITELSGYGEVGREIGTIDKLTLQDGELRSASAPGYTFHGWYQNPECTGDPITKEFRIEKDSAHDFYAKWTPNVYKVRFEAGTGNIITKENVQPAEGDTGNILEGYVVYDTILDGGIRFSGSDYTENLPYAWNMGNIFQGWLFDPYGDYDKAGTEHSQFNKEHFPSFNTDADPETPAMVFKADFRNVRITYHINGGKWKNRPDMDLEEVCVTNPSYGDPLAGYTRKVNGEDVTYEIVDTDAAYFNAHKTYVEDDYRHEISRKGYTFGGWFDSKGITDGSEVRSVPKYGDIHVYARWIPNTYHLKLYAKDEDMVYHAAIVTDEPSQEDVPIDYFMTVGNEIKKVNEMAGHENESWPPRVESSWYAHNIGIIPQNENEKRFLLGFTFDSLDPGDSREGVEGHQEYKNYAANVMQLQNDGLLFRCNYADTPGTIFHLPSDDIYNPEAIEGTSMVPDYPDGCEIDLYAVYRERSLVFVESITDEGILKETIMATYPWQTWSDYPTKQYDRDKKYWNSKGYTLTGWYVNGRDINEARRYPDDAGEYESKKGGWKNDATTLGTFDIMVYTGYVPVVVIEDVVLSANEDASTPQTTSGYSFPIPKSVKESALDYTINNKDGLNFVTYEELMAHRYDQSDDWNLPGIQNANANNTVAMKVEFFKNDEGGGSLAGEPCWVKNDGTSELSKGAVSGDYRMQFTLYHSMVITEQKEFRFDFTVTSQNPALSDQKIIMKDMEIRLKPTKYQVVYEVDPQGNPVTDAHGFQVNEENPGIYNKVERVPLGSMVVGKSEIPSVTGYTGIGNWYWKKGQGTNSREISYGGLLSLPVKAEDQGMIRLTTDYKVAENYLSADLNSAYNFEIYSSGDSNRLTGYDSDKRLIPYHTQISLKPVKTDQYPEYIHFVIGPSGSQTVLSLPELAGTPETDGSYRFLMPDADVRAVYSRTKQLYLENGTILLEPDGYTQNGKKEIWRGDYEILMDSENNQKNKETEYVLQLSGDLMNRKISLGNLNITSPDSIELKNNSRASLVPEYAGTVSEITARNITVPSDSELIIKEGTKGSGGTLKLAPQKDYAAIGGYRAPNGKITLSSVDITMTLPQGSAASGIGTGSEGGGDIAIDHCKISATENVSASAVYRGSWIGGHGVGNVTLTACEIMSSGTESFGKGSSAIDGDKVLIQGCRLGTHEDPLPNKIHGAEELEFNLFRENGTDIHTEVYQKMDSGYAVSSDPAGNIRVKGNSKIESYVTNPAPGFYQGRMDIFTAREDVMIANHQILETANSDITILEDRVSLGTTTFYHDGSYLLIKDRERNESHSVTVEGISHAKEIVSRNVTLKNLTIKADTPLKVTGKLTVTEKLTIEDAELRVKSISPEGEMSVDGSVTGSGHYRQENGSFTAKNQIHCPALDMTLDHVNTEAPSIGVHNLVISGGTASAEPGGMIGSLGRENEVTNVTINEAASVTASVVGALGAQDDTFTFVDSDEGTVNGTLVQDHYRLSYDLGGEAGYNTDELHKVLRSSRTQAGDENFIPSIPEEPQYTGQTESLFRNWYLKDNEEILHVLSENPVDGFEFRIPGLTESEIAYAKKPAGSDSGQPGTLTLYAWIQSDSESEITEGRKFQSFNGASSATIRKNGSWTAKFEMQGGVLPEADYGFQVPDLPRGTRLTLEILKQNESLPVFYHYTLADGATEGSVIPFSVFERMGKPGIHPSTPEKGESYLLAADFADDHTTGNEELKSVKLVVKTGASVPAVLGNVSYDREAPPAAAVTERDGLVSVTYEGDDRLMDKNLYLSVNFTRPVSYKGRAGLTAAEGTSFSSEWISNSQAVFDLGQTAEKPFRKQDMSFTLNGVDDGDYHYSWQLLASAGKPAIYDKELAVSGESVITIAQNLPYMKVTPMEAMEKSRVLTTGTAHELSFLVDTNQKMMITTSGEIQGRLPGSFSEYNLSISQTGETEAGLIYTAVLPASLDAGTYRLRFSLLPDSDFDDEYFTIILKDPE